MLIIVFAFNCRQRFAALQQLRGFQPQMFQARGKVIKNFNVLATFQPAIVPKPAVTTRTYSSVN